MAKLIILCCFLWTLKSSALPILEPDSLDVMCPPCPTDLPVCSNILVEVARKTGFPDCGCPRYECHDKEPVCESSMRFYRNKCTVCDPCEPLAVRCKENCSVEEETPNCLTDNNEYKEIGAVWSEDNGCTTATCLGGYVSRTSVQCNHIYPCNKPIRIEGQCCPVCPEEVDESGSYYEPFDGTTMGPEIIEGEDSAEEITIKYINSTSEIPAVTESSTSSSVNSSNMPTESSALVTDSTNNPTTSSEIYTPTPITSESTSAADTTTDSSSESVGYIATSESPDLRNVVTEEEATSSSDIPIETTINPTTSDNLETSTGASTTIEASTDNDTIKTEKTTEEKYDISSESVKINSFMTDDPFTDQQDPVVPESTSQVKDFNDTNVLHYADVPQEQIKNGLTWGYITAFISGLVVFVVFVAIVTIFMYRRYFEIKKYHAISTAAVSQQPRETVAL
ncbi:uncharacterized protein Rcd2 [Drosophila takahashii]|uniref:uncharacterized protein Rcd2 n=1 Tax=Drosophila takahashii TaxID=29030 RepID=UPI001CF82AC2|nr:flocculation protein FLO11 [Drosophila takahashii]